MKNELLQISDKNTIHVINEIGGVIFRKHGIKINQCYITTFKTLPSALQDVEYEGKYIAPYNIVMDIKYTNRDPFGENKNIIFKDMHKLNEGMYLELDSEWLNKIRFLYVDDEEKFEQCIEHTFIGLNKIDEFIGRLAECMQLYVGRYYAIRAFGENPEKDNERKFDNKIKDRVIMLCECFMAVAIKEYISTGTFDIEGLGARLNSILEMAQSQTNHFLTMIVPMLIDEASKDGGVLAGFLMAEKLNSYLKFDSNNNYVGEILTKCKNLKLARVSLNIDCNEKQLPQVESFLSRGPKEIDLTGLRRQFDLAMVNKDSMMNDFTKKELIGKLYDLIDTIDVYTSNPRVTREDLMDLNDLKEEINYALNDIRLINIKTRRNTVNLNYNLPAGYRQ
jgi:hypothetical protein